ncbi:MAG: pantoate--beta-alanine ligase [Acidimicrobiia bacterium]|jgi:pantoate--beta-alanine ligase
MRTVTTISEVRAACDEVRRADTIVGFVPTMGAFHAGHRSLMSTARRECGFVVVSLFVNPTQFGPNEDLAAYPRDVDRDAAAAAAEGVDLLFCPSVEEMYPEPGRTTVHVDGLTDRLCGARRPGHFDGVTTVVSKLFSIVGPCTAFFGRKDAQQLAVVRRMTRDLDLPVELVGCPLVREPDGVAMSSRNAYLTEGQRTAARVLSRSLRAGADLVVQGERTAVVVRDAIVGVIATEPLVELDYAEIVDAASLEPRDRLAGEVLIAVAANVGRARLIDNCTIVVDGDDVTVDLGVIAEPQS